MTFVAEFQLKVSANSVFTILFINLYLNFLIKIKNREDICWKPSSTRKTLCRCGMVWVCVCGGNTSLLTTKMYSEIVLYLGGGCTSQQVFNNSFS